jgi:multidrug efflux pump subunit AcrB
MVSLGTLVNVREIGGPIFVNRYNLYTCASVTGNLRPGVSSGEIITAVDRLANQTLPLSMKTEWTELMFMQIRAGNTAMYVFALAVMCVFLALAALYESWSLPLSVLLSVPVAVFGAFVGLLLRKFDFDVYGQIGLVVLIGLAAKNAILIVEFAKTEFEQGKDLASAALHGAQLRLRPILMTSFAFILGCVPLWFAKGAGAASREILGTVVVAGMLAATCLAVFLIPVLFVVVERLAGAERRLEARLAHADNETALAGERH